MILVVYTLAKKTPAQSFGKKNPCSPPCHLKPNWVRRIPAPPRPTFSEVHVDGRLRGEPLGQERVGVPGRGRGASRASLAAADRAVAVVVVFFGA